MTRRCEVASCSCKQHRCSLSGLHHIHSLSRLTRNLMFLLSTLHALQYLVSFNAGPGRYAGQ